MKENALFDTNSYKILANLRFSAKNGTKNA